MFLHLLSSGADHAHGAILPFNWNHLTWALFLGGLSAISLPLGSALGLIVKPQPRVTAALTAFGGGALLAALTIELVAPTANELVEASKHLSRTLAEGGSEAALLAARTGFDAHTLEMASILFGMIGGGFLFFVLDQLVNAQGGFLRKTATTIAYISQNRKQRQARILGHLSKVNILRSLPPNYINKLVDIVRPRVFLDGENIFDEGDRGDVMYFIVSGSVALFHEGKPLKILEPGDVLGEIALLTGAPRTARAVAKGKLETLALHKQDFDSLRAEAHELDDATRALAHERIEELQERHAHAALNAAEWAANAREALQTGTELPTPDELRNAKKEHSGAPLAIWLGILLDGIPESFVIGAGFLGLLLVKAQSGGIDAVTLGQVIPYTLIAGLFLSNFPEAMSSSIGMRLQGWGRGKILFMWVVLMVMTALGAGVGYWAGETMPHSIVVAIEGMAAGAMLTMIASAMLPEAIHLGGPNVTGVSVLSGFLAAVAFKLFE